MNNGLLIAIDGPCASGKGTIAPLLAAKMGGVHFYTGSMYRALALACLKENIKPEDAERVIEKLQHITIELKVENQKETAVYLNGENVSKQIMNSECAVGASHLSRIPEVKKYMVNAQRNVAQHAATNGIKVIMEGQDIGNHVLPDADFKLFLTADVIVRAKRRLEQYKQLGREKTLEDVINETEERDRNDTMRELNPLSADPARDGYFVLDDSQLTEEETLDTIVKEMIKRGLSV